MKDRTSPLISAAHPRIHFLLVILSIVGALASNSVCPAAKEPDLLDYDAWRIPVSAVSTSDDGSAVPLRKPMPGFTIRKGSAQWDATEFIKALGVEPGPGAEATYDPPSATLIVKDTKENLETIGLVLSYTGLADAPEHLVCEYSVYDCILVHDPKTNLVVWPSIAELSEKGSEKVRLLDHISGTTKSGQRAKFSRRSPSPDDGSQPKSADESADREVLGPREMGIAAEVESVVGPDNLIDTNLSFSWRGRISKEISSSLSFTTIFTSWDCHPVVVQVSASEGVPEKYQVVTASLRLATPAEWSLKSLTEIADQVKKLRASWKASNP